MAWVAFQRMRAAEPQVSAPYRGVLADRADEGAGGTPPAVAWADTPEETPGAASSEPGTSAQFPHLVGSYVVVLVGAWVIANVFYAPKAATSLQGEGLLAVGLFIAQGLERFLDPFARWAGAIPKETAQAAGASSNMDKVALEKARDRAFAAADGAAVVGADDAKDKERKAANAQAALNQFRANTAVVIWAAGCLAGLLLAAVLDLRLLNAVGAGVSETWDIAVSGIAIGSAAKPLHDLVGALKARKDETDGAPANTGGS